MTTTTHPDEPTRARPHVAVTRIVRNQSARSGAKLELIVLHTTEGKNIKGTADLVGLGNWFDNPAAQASSHVAVDDEGKSARFVNDDRKAWAQAFYNSPALSIEQVGQAVETNQEFTTAQRKEVARWIAQWSADHGIPIRHGRVSKDGRILTSGVVQHKDLGNLGGGHHDCGDHYPFADVLKLARWYKRNR